MADKSIYPTDVDRAILSTNGNSTYYRSKFMAGVEHRLKNKLDLSADTDSRFNLDWVDPLDPDLIERLRFKDEDYDSFVYDGFTPMTSISYRAYGTTTLWFVIVYVNGYLNPLEIPNGVMLKLPKAEVLEKQLRRKTATEQLIGKVITV